MSNHNVKFTDSIYQHIEDNLSCFIKTRYPKLINNAAIKSLIDRWLYGRKKENPIDSKFTIYSDIIRIFEQGELKDVLAKLRYPLEIMIGVLAQNIISSSDGALGRGIKNLNQSIAKSIMLAKSDPVMNDKLKFQILKFSKLYTSEYDLKYEGVVFSFKNKQYKCTGIFAPINQILGFFKYKR